MQPHEILDVITSTDPPVEQPELVKQSPQSSPTVSRSLTVLETQGEIRRLLVGGRNLIYPAGSLPECLQ